MGKLFGTNGVRGIFGEDLTLEFVHDLALSVGTFFNSGPILVGYDGRDSSIVIAKTVCRALNYIGIDCSLAGLVPTPCLEYAVKTLQYRGGIMITASHNPPQYNGIKPVDSDGVEISRDDELKIEEVYFTKSWRNATKPWGNTVLDDRTISAYHNGITSKVNSVAIKSKQFSVALDTGNGAQAVTAPILCEKLGCSTITIHDEIDSNFSGRGSEPTPDNLSQLSKTVIDSGADFGVAFDGDGDRSLFCDEKGKVLTGDQSALLLSRYLLSTNPNSTIVTCINSSSAIEQIAKESNSRVIRTKVGSVEVSRKMMPVDALVGFEENGGFMYGPHNHVRDGAMTMAILLDMLAASKKTVSEMVQDLPVSFTRKDKLACSAQDAEKLFSALRLQYPDADTIDGIKVTIDKNSWFMVRASGTEPIIRIYAESDSAQNLDELMSEQIQKIKSILSE